MKTEHVRRPVSYISWMPLLMATLNTFVFPSRVRHGYSFSESSQGQSFYMSLFLPELFSQEVLEREIWLNCGWGHYLCVFSHSFDSHKLKKMSMWYGFQQGTTRRCGWRTTRSNLSVEIVVLYTVVCLLTTISGFFGTVELLELIHIASLFCLN